LLESQPGPDVQVAWQGGGPTLMGLEFFKKSIDCVERHRRPAQRVSYTLQTNGTKIHSEWAAFLGAHDFLIGLSIDGPRHLHDAYRVDLSLCRLQGVLLTHRSTYERDGRSPPPRPLRGRSLGASAGEPASP
jgi:hypothetical protein